MRDFRGGAREFFVSGKPGPKTAPGKDAARARIIELRAAGHSIDGSPPRWPPRARR